MLLSGLCDHALWIHLGGKNIVTHSTGQILQHGAAPDEAYAALLTPLGRPRLPHVKPPSRRAATSTTMSFRLNGTLLAGESRWRRMDGVYFVGNNKISVGSVQTLQLSFGMVEEDQTPPSSSVSRLVHVGTWGQFVGTAVWFGSRCCVDIYLVTLSCCRRRRGRGAVLVA